MLLKILTFGLLKHCSENVNMNIRIVAYIKMCACPQRVATI